MSTLSVDPIVLGLDFCYGCLIVQVAWESPWTFQTGIPVFFNTTKVTLVVIIRQFFFAAFLLMNFHEIRTLIIF